MTLRTQSKGTICTDRRYQILTMLLLAVTLLSALPILRNKMNSSPYMALLYWGAVIVAIQFYFVSIHVPGRIINQSVVKGYAISGAVIYIAIGFILGVFMKKLKASPYDISPLGILNNAATILPALVAREMIRGYGFGTAWYRCKHRYIILTLITIIMALTDINFGKIEQIKDMEGIVVFIVSDIGTAFSKNILASVLVFYGAPISAILYLGIIEVFQKTFPFLPELSWLASGTIGIAFPIIYAMVVAEYSKTESEGRRHEDPKGNATYLIALFLSVLFSWFCVGVFTIYPSIILTGSMEPEIFPGDIVLIQKILEEDKIYKLMEGDVINFKRDGYTVTHRIEEIITDEAGNRSFRTKGDNNKSADEIIVEPNDINGIVVNVVPKVGYPILLLKSGNVIPEGVIDDEQTKTEFNEVGNAEQPASNAGESAK